MKKNVNIIIAIAAIIFSVFSLIEGSRVLLGLSVPEYVVFTPLLIYNIIMGITGVYVGVQILQQHINALRNSAVISLFHISILITISLLYLFDSVVSIHSVYAMIFRTVFWLIITTTIWAINNYIQTKKEK
ncbi:MAG: hypothetical protein ROY99_05755 [Ignavibacterium sp.]|jgi:hypothetical protein|nr:hypothetical protein [Ignavibacterium sp.]